jgi:multiple sugar transport system substrate-binding protein
MRPVLAALAAAGLSTGAMAQSDPLVVAMHYTEEQAAPLLACFDRYAEETGTAVEYQQISYRDYLQTVLTSRIGGQAPDIYNIYSIWAAQMVDNGVLDPAPDELASYVRDTYVEGTVEAATIDGTLWGVPTEVSVYMLVSNMALLEEAGYSEPPATFEELKEIAAAITTRNDQDRIETAGFAFAESSSGAGVVHPFYAMLYSQGADVYAEDYSEANLESDAAREVAAMQQSLVAEGITDRSVDGYDFPAGGIGMIVMANWLESAIREGFGDDFDQVRVSPIPMGEDWRTLQYAFFMGVDSTSDRKEAAWDLVRWVNSPESVAEAGAASCVGEMMDGLGALTANTADQAALGEMDDFTRPFWQALEEDRAISQPNVLQAAEIEGMIAQTLDTVIAGDAEPGPAMEELDRNVEDILFEFY